MRAAQGRAPAPRAPPCDWSIFTRALICQLSPVNIAAWRPEGPVHHDLQRSLRGDPDRGGLVTGHLEAVVSLEMFIQLVCPVAHPPDVDTEVIRILRSGADGERMPLK